LRTLRAQSVPSLVLLTDLQVIARALPRLWLHAARTPSSVQPRESISGESISGDRAFPGIARNRRCVALSSSIAALRRFHRSSDCRNANIHRRSIQSGDPDPPRHGGTRAQCLGGDERVDDTGSCDRSYPYHFLISPSLILTLLSDHSGSHFSSPQCDDLTTNTVSTSVPALNHRNAVQHLIYADAERPSSSQDEPQVKIPPQGHKKNESDTLNRTPNRSCWRDRSSCQNVPHSGQPAPPAGRNPLFQGQQPILERAVCLDGMRPKT
jgi:hypothetical protein